jgi:4-amino-4-deoxy-L-arabinose transferase-like glycosyltransferase
MLTIDQSTPKAGYSIWQLLIHNIHGPLHSLVVYLFRLVHDGDAWLRVPSALAGVVAVVFFYRWARRYLDVAAARLAALLLAVHPLHIHYSQEVRNYAFVFLFAMMACVAFERFRERATRRSGGAYVLAMAAAALSNFTAAFIFAVHSLIYLFGGGRWTVNLRRWAVVGVVILVLISPWVYRITTYIDVSRLVTPVMPGQIETAERLRGETTVAWTAIPYALYAFSVGFTMGPSLRELHDQATMAAVLADHWPAVVWTAALFGSLLLAGIASGRRRRRWGELGLYMVLPVALTLVLNWQNAKAFNVRYVLLSLPAYLCLVAAGVIVVGERWRTVASLAVVLTMLTSLGHYYYDGRYAKEDVRGAMRYVEKRMDTGGDHVCVFAPTVFDVARRYRTGDYVLYRAFQRNWVDKSSVDAQLDPMFAACNSVWYVRARPWVDDYDGYLWRSLRSRYRVVEQTQFVGVKVFLMVKEDQHGERI